MSATKQPRRSEQRPGYIWPGPYTRGGSEVITDLERAKHETDKAANLHNQDRYVIQWEEGYVVMSYSDLWDYFGDEMKDETVYSVKAPGRDRGKKWIGEP